MSVLNTPRTSLTDAFGRTVTYLRVSVTDRCDLRCTYCMPERMTFLPKPDVLTLEELERLCAVFVGMGVCKIRLTGGEPLTRRNMLWLVQRLGAWCSSGALDEVTLTTNGTRLVEFASPLYEAGVRRINVSLDTLDPEKFRRVTRGGDLVRVLAGIEAAAVAGLGIKINTVALTGINAIEIPDMIAWAHERGFDLTLIEAMPMGETGEDRLAAYLPLDSIRTRLASFWRLDDIPVTTGGPARYVRIRETGGRLGFITPLSHNFCEACNRMRLTCTGQLYQCLGQGENADLRTLLRGGENDAAIESEILAAVARKPKGHDFDVTRLNRPVIQRHMSVTGG